MTTVTGAITTAAGTPPRGASVTVTLVDQAGRATPGFAGTCEVLGVVSVPVAPDGSWSVSLTPSADITSPRGPTLYQVTERVQTGVSASYYISVPATGPAWVGSLRVTLPGAAAEQMAGYLPLTGGTMTGPIVLPDASPAASQAYVASHGGGGGGTPSGTVVAETSHGQAASPGAATTYARGDHTHGTPALPTPAAIGAATTGHTHSGVYDPAGSAATALASAQAYADSGDALCLTRAGNLADLQSASAARGNLGLGGAALLGIGTTPGTVAAGDDGRITGALQRSTASAKGDLVVATASATMTRLGVGSDGQVLMADSAQAGGVKWATPSGGGGGVRVARARVTSGDITLPNTGGSWQILDQATSAPLVLVVAASAGEYIDIALRGMRSQTGSAYLDLVVIAAGGIVRHISTESAAPAGEGDPGLYPAAGFHTYAGGDLIVDPGDISGGQVTIGLAVKATGVGTLYASATYPWRWRAINHRAPA